MQNETYVSYLKLCEVLKEAPRSEIYDQITDCKDSKKLYQIKAFIDNERQSFEQRVKPNHENFFRKLFNL